jgi:hypothetical protein
MNEFEHNWDRLIRQARRADAVGGSLTPPPGFVTRVVSLGRSEAQSGNPLWELAALRGLLAAGVLTAVCLLVMWPAYNDSTDDDALAEFVDPISEVALLE